MTTQAANRNTPYRGVNSITIGAKTGVHIYAGGLLFNDAGWGRGGVPTASTPVLGVVRNEVDNTLGANGALQVTGDREGGYPFVNGASGQALAALDIGNDVFAIDDQTVGKTSASGTLPIAGKLVAFGADGVPWVQIK